MPDDGAGPDAEMVVLLDDERRAVGTAPKHLVHHAATPLHLAFSCWLVDPAGRTLLTRRAASKRTWPGAWTNSFCGHPAPGEPPQEAVVRRGRTELGVRVEDLRVVLPEFGYQARMADGTMENEFCPVWTGALPDGGDVRPDPAEVDDLRWVPLAELDDLLTGAPDAHSPWMRLQWEQLRGLLLPVGTPVG